MAIPIFDENTETLYNFDPKLAKHLADIKGHALRKVLYTAIDDTATEATSNPADIRLVDTFLNDCSAWHNKGGEVNWVWERGATSGLGNLFSLSGDHYYIDITGCDGNEALIHGDMKHFQSPISFSAYLEMLYGLGRSLGVPTHIALMGYSVLALFIEKEHPCYNKFYEALYEIALNLQLETGQAFRVRCFNARIMLELEDKIGKHETVLRIRERKDQAVGLEIYGSHGDSDVLAKEMVNSQPYGFAYQVFSSREELNAWAFAGSDLQSYVAGFIIGTKQWSRFVGMIAEAL